MNATSVTTLEKSQKMNRKESVLPVSLKTSDKGTVKHALNKFPQQINYSKKFWNKEERLKG